MLFFIITGSLFWLIIFGAISYISLFYGIIALSITYLLLVKIKLWPPQLLAHISLVRIFSYFVYLFVEIVKAAWVVTKICWGKQKTLSPSFIWIESKLAEETKIAIYAQSITLTPGTVTVLVNERKLLVHALTNEALADLKAGDMEQKLLKLF